MRLNCKSFALAMLATGALVAPGSASADSQQCFGEGVAAVAQEGLVGPFVSSSAQADRGTSNGEPGTFGQTVVPFTKTEFCG